MKKIILLCLIVMPLGALGALGEPSTSCPMGMLKIRQNYINLATTTCPAGTVKVGTIQNCQSINQGICALYIPANSTYSDSTGTYTYTDICPYE